MKKTVPFAISALSAIIAFAGLPLLAQAEESPVGLWKSIDDKSGKPKALIRITETGGELQGKIEKLFLEADAPEKNPKCDKCEGANKDQPIVGMTILSGLKKDGDEYSGGKILDPGNGKLYSSKLSVIENNKKLNVRGYIGAPMFGRTQTWLREQ
ncbi:DUF2147 domain-containing protein [Undibacterium sp. CY18W]|uniref:DUF2147 domain-containing protein n=1 Tax=Undibacterium hunanense TaxID=2762292 RepID=A0ABR6ZNX2_9BURK|nr:DUF2147 domain-containing protein [Undibacterium hunanense]MBC3917563.1 DUF2147 domain-containing protein [Undibacterium hunanense]